MRAVGRMGCPVAHDDDAEDRALQSVARLSQQGTLAEAYLAKAEECLRLAETATGTRARDQWLRLAEGWRSLAALGMWSDGGASQAK